METISLPTISKAVKAVKQSKNIYCIASINNTENKN